eukprot:1767442-Rhodomonas_salina.1
MPFYLLIPCLLLPTDPLGAAPRTTSTRTGPLSSTRPARWWCRGTWSRSTRGTTTSGATRCAWLTWPLRWPKTTSGPKCCVLKTAVSGCERRTTEAVSKTEYGKPHTERERERERER